LKIGIIGDEPAGPILAKAWAAAGHEIVGAWVESPLAIERIEALLPDVPIASMLAVAEDSELVLLAVPNSDIELVCDGIAGFGLFGPKKLVVHLSPLAGIGLLGSAANQGAVPIALHPVMHFTGTTMDLQVLKNTSVAVSAPEVLMPIAQALAIELGAEPIVVLNDQRAAYAEAFGVASGFSSLVVSQAIGILEAAGMENPARLIAPVVRAAVERALAQGALRIDPKDFL
jgi:predicted short-subunit dehydrogenase-like oxidoreductase (DUF2520 family)